MKFSLVNEKEIYQNMKSKNLENSPVELWSTSHPHPILVQTLTGLVPLGIRYVDNIFATSFSVIPVPSSELADKGSKLSLEPWKRVTSLSMKQVSSLQLQSFIRQ